MGRQGEMAPISAILKPVMDFALPPRCPICGILVDDDNRFCLGCWQNLKFLSEPWCDSCGVPFAFERPAGSLCLHCLEHPPTHDGVRAVVSYDNHSAQLVTRLKYGGRLGLARLIAEHLVKFSLPLPSDSLIVPVPLHRWRLWSRGFNQSVLIGRTLAELTGLPLELDIISRKNATPPLHSKSAKQRRKIVKDAFTVPDNARAPIAGKTIILVDDVYTTGSTSNACAGVLKHGGADKVLVFCWAGVLAGEDTI